MAFAEGFRRERLPEVTVELDESIDVRQAYVRNVDTYPSLLVMRRTTADGASTNSEPASRGVTLARAGYSVRVGPALGITPAFVLEPGEDGIEPELVAPWVNGSDILEGEMRYRERQIITLHDDHGKLRDLDDFPRAKARLEAFKPRLQNRSIVRKGAEWFRPIDRVVAAEWRRPKLLIPELAKVPRVALDHSDAIPSHGVYAIFAPDDDLTDLYERLRNGGLQERLQFLAPKVKGQYYRCYKRFLDRLSL
jgi:hypothetical protein